LELLIVTPQLLRFAIFSLIFENKNLLRKPQMPHDDQLTEHFIYLHKQKKIFSIVAFWPQKKQTNVFFLYFSTGGQIFG